MEATTTDTPQAATESSGTEALPSVPVTLTQKAVNMFKATRKEEGIGAEAGLRIAVRGGGCSGFEYALDFEQSERPNDFVYQQGDLRVFVDALSARYLEGTEIDYVMGMQGAGFKFNNPNAVGSCGCGSSFAV